jgi:uncharacterized protein with HEPN domain
VHDYFGVDPEIVWIIATTDVPRLRSDLAVLSA